MSVRPTGSTDYESRRLTSSHPLIGIIMTLGDKHTDCIKRDRYDEAKSVVKIHASHM